MKNIILILVLFLSFSCSKKESNSDDFLTDNNKVTVSLKVNGISISELPLNKSATVSQALYGIQIYVNPVPPLKGEFWEYEKVAYGLFDNFNDVKVELEKDKTYLFEIAYLPKGKDVVYYYSSKDCWESPFMTMNWGASPINTIVYSKSEVLYSLGLSWVNQTDVRNNGTYREVDRYWGFTSDIKPVENGTISIDMKRTVFGLTFKAKKTVNNNYDKILVTLNASAGQGETKRKYYFSLNQDGTYSDIVIPYISLSSPQKSVMDINYIEKTKLSIGTDLNPAEIYFGDISLKRNTMHIVEFDAAPKPTVTPGLGLKIESTPMTTEKVVLP